MARILLLATSSFAGMGPYVASLINAFSPDDSVRFFLIEREDRYFSRNIRKELLPLCTIRSEKTPTKLRTLYDITINPYGPHDKEIKRLVKHEQFDIVHAVNPVTDVPLMRSIAAMTRVLYTVHDLHPHEARKAFYKIWRQRVLFSRMLRAVDSSPYLLTNSRVQLDEQRRIYPDKHSFYTSFPSLVTSQIINGDMAVPELEGVDNYVLFFGRIEAYKGLDVLVEAFKNSALARDTKLVIAGDGHFVPDATCDNVIFLNRYIDDREIKALYTNAMCVVYPYISATQSGVLSVASYFGTPIIASDVPFFVEVLGEDYPYMFPVGDSKKLTALLDSVRDNRKVMAERSTNLYPAKYGAEKIREDLMTVYGKILSE